MSEADREHEIEAVLASSRQRPSSPRWLWIVAVVIGLACAAAFVIALVRGGDAPSITGAPPVAGSGRFGFPTGLVLGIGIGIAVGWFAARRDHHSSRSNP
ncbi:hypothetical protein BH11MYX3_BH11MYX3_12210 [soil metagenome]